ncbi:hypothetical protein DASC09_019900 [Saccharomycopsis crataegensis]|uniref:MMS19 nucleotide excision repair protein n=1 Tax=Saccharomycopsis crataegensis TaxID=43959 RepID=A0AAV5QJJ4_9ASCO|nr:hypothetical protein DASC09_019900 [Saccharomycopsis crataegensis]
MTIKSFRTAINAFIVRLKDNYPEFIIRLHHTLTNSHNDFQTYSSTITILIDLYTTAPSPNADVIFKSNLLREVVAYLRDLSVYDKQDNLNIKEAMVLFEKLHPKLALEEKMEFAKDYGLATYIWDIMINDDSDLIRPHKKLFNLYFGNSFYRINTLDQWIIEQFMIPILRNPSNPQSTSLCFEFLSKLYSNVVPDSKITAIICDLLKPISTKSSSSSSKKLGIFKTHKATPKPEFLPQPVLIDALQYFARIFEAHKESIPDLMKIETSTNLWDSVSYLFQKFNTSFAVQYHVLYFAHFFLITEPKFDENEVKKLLWSSNFITRNLLDAYESQKDPTVRGDKYPKDLCVVMNFKSLRKYLQKSKSDGDKINTDQMIDILKFINYLLDHWKSVNITTKNSIQAITDLVEFCLPRVPQNDKRSLINKLLVILDNDTSHDDATIPVAHFYARHSLDKNFDKQIDIVLFFPYVAKKTKNVKKRLEEIHGKSQILCLQDQEEFTFMLNCLASQSFKQKYKLRDMIRQGNYLNLFIPNITDLHTDDAKTLMLICLVLSLACLELDEEYYSNLSSLLANVGDDDVFKRRILSFSGNVIINSKSSNPLINHPTFLMEIYSLALSSEDHDVKTLAYKVINLLVVFRDPEKKDILREIIKEWDFFNTLFVPVLKDPQSLLHGSVTNCLESLGKMGDFQEEFETTNVISLMVDYFCTRQQYEKNFFYFIGGYFGEDGGVDDTIRSICLYKGNIFKTLPKAIELSKSTIVAKKFKENCWVLTYLCQIFSSVLEEYPVCVKDFTRKQAHDIYSITLDIVRSAPQDTLDKIGIDYIVKLWRDLELDEIPDEDDFLKTLTRLFNDCLPYVSREDDTLRDGFTHAKEMIQDILTIITKYIGDTPNKSKDFRAAYYFFKPLMKLLNQSVPVSLTVSIWQFFYKIIRDRANGKIVEFFFDNVKEPVVPSWGSVVMLKHLRGEYSVASATISFCWKVVTYYPGTVYATYILKDFGVNESMSQLKERFRNDFEIMNRLEDIESAG